MGTHLNVSLTLLGYKDLTNTNELPNVKDVSNDKNSPTVVPVSSNQVFYGVLTGSDLKDYYRFTFDKSINANINVTIIAPRAESLIISTEFSQNNNPYSYSTTYPASHPVIANVLTNFASIGLSVPYYYGTNSTTLRFIYRISITSNDFQNSNATSTTSRASSLGGFEFIFIAGFIVLVVFRSKGNRLS